MRMSSMLLANALSGAGDSDLLLAFSGEAETAEKASRDGISTPVGTKPVQTLLQTFVREWSAEGLQDSAGALLLLRSTGLRGGPAAYGRSLRRAALALVCYGADSARLTRGVSTAALRFEYLQPDEVRGQPPGDSFARPHFGEFATLYAESAAKESFDCLLTSYALDLSPNVFRCSERGGEGCNRIEGPQTAHVLRPGGMWANFGPLAYDADHDEAEREFTVNRSEFTRQSLFLASHWPFVALCFIQRNDVARRAAYDSGKLDSSNEVEPTFTANMAHDLFREVFGDEFARRLAAAAGNASSAVAGTIDFVAESETFKAAKHATASGISKAAESVGQSQVVRSAVAKHLGSLADQANSRLAERASQL
eukprot:g23951.t1